MAMQILSPEAFAEKVRDYGTKQVQLIAKNAALAVFQEIYTNLLMLTPVLTGHARHNWQTNVGSPITEEIEGVAGVEETGQTLTGDETGAISDMRSQYLGSASLAIFITNNAPYIQKLDAGSSSKAPAGIVLPAISASLAVLKDKKLNLT